jgi:hypothetical protein
MPDINRRGEIARGGGRARMWLTDDRELHRDDVTLLVARNGRWFGARVGHGVFNDDGLIPGGDTMMLAGDYNAARGAVGQDGTVALWRDYPDGGDVQLLAMDGSVKTIRDAFPPGNGSFAVLDAQRAAWVDASTGQMRAFGMAVPRVLPGPVHNLNLFVLAGVVWVAYHSHDSIGIVAHPATTLHGYRFPAGFYLSVRETVKGIVLSVAANPNDDPGYDRVLDPAAPRVDLLALVPGTEPKPEPKPDEPKPDPAPMSIPDRSAEAAAFLAPRLRYVKGDKAATSEATFAAVNALCIEFRKTDPRWFLLVKDPGQNNVRLRGVDVLLYQINATQAQVLDVVGDGDGHDGPPWPTWQPKDIRPIEQAKMPFTDGVSRSRRRTPTTAATTTPASVIAAARRGMLRSTRPGATGATRVTRTASSLRRGRRSRRSSPGSRTSGC